MEFTKTVHCIKRGKCKSLTLGKQYDVVRVQNGKHENSNIPYSGVWVVNDNDIVKYYSSKRFIDRVKYREQILNELLK